MCSRGKGLAKRRKTDTRAKQPGFCTLLLSAPHWHYATESSGSGVSDFQPRLYCSLPQEIQFLWVKCTWTWERNMSVGGAEEHGSTLPVYSRNNLIPSRALQITSSMSSLHKGCITSLTLEKAGGGAGSSGWHNPAKISFLPRKVRAVIKGSCQWQIRYDKLNHTPC